MSRGAVLLKATAAITAWMLASSTLIFMNKQIYNEGFHFPMMATALGQLFSYVGGLALVRANLFPCRPLPTLRELCRNVLPIVAASVATLWLGNHAYLSLSVAFIQILKGLTPPLTLLLDNALGVAPLAPLQVLAVMMTGGGTGFGAVVEARSATFSWEGFVAFVGSSVTEALRVVLVGRLQRPGAGLGRFNTAESLVFISLPCAVCLLGMSLAFESPAVLGVGWALMRRKPLFYFGAFASSFLVNMTCYVAIQVTSSVTFKVVGCVKNTLVIGLGVLRGDVVTALQMFGYLVSVSGFVLYTILPAKHTKVA